MLILPRAVSAIERLYKRLTAYRCFCPPERLMPRSPTSVISPAGNMARSGSNSEALTALQYRFSSKGKPNRMLSRIEFDYWKPVSRSLVVTIGAPTWIHAIWGQYATFPPKVTFPAVDRISAARSTQ